MKSEKALLQEQYSEALELSKDVESQIQKEQARLAEIARQEAERKSNSSSKVQTQVEAAVFQGMVLPFQLVHGQSLQTGA